ncbi:unnamed protein product [Mytilus edulis]|uniref:Uncharacterized protein n=1 Tax=Mytilus edulis TaxID=6550 RepID=A0A8S3QJK9_MYTED|nr:unnamed protein product [Mytilus edulis]
MSSWIPKPSKSATLEDVIDKIKSDVVHLASNKYSSFYNTSPDEKKAIQSLRNRDDIVIKPADKGNKHQNSQLDCKEQNGLYEKAQDSSSGEHSLLTRIICHMSNMSETMKDEFVHLLLNSGVDPNLEKMGQDSPLICAVKLNKPELVKTLLRFGADVNHVGLYNNTALQICCSTHRGLMMFAKIGDFKTMEFIIRYGADKHTVDSYGNTILHVCLSNKHNARDVPDVDGNTLLHHAAKGGFNKTVSLLMKRGWNALDRNKDRKYCSAFNSKISYTCQQKDVRDNVSVGNQPLVTGILLNHGEDPNQHTAEFIPLISAVHQKRHGFTVLLLSRLVLTSI